MGQHTVSSADYKQQPGWFKALNGLWKASYPLGTAVKLDKDALIRDARKSTGLKDLGADFWEESLERLLESLNSEARLHPVGRFITKKRLENLLCVRLRAEDYFKKYPEILEQELYPVTVIMGLQRTGTTKLQRLMAADPGCRALRSWEALNPAPIKGDDKTGKERIKFAKMSENALRYLSPGFFAIHPVEHAAPEEDILLLDTTFLSTTAEATTHVPSYAAWLETIDQSPAYAYGAKLLKLLQWQRPAERWVLKSPHHLEFPDLIEQHYGDVQYVWPHRNVHEAITSFLSMVAYSRVMFSNDVDANEVAEHWVRKIGYMLDKAMAFRQNPARNQRVVDVRYEDLVRDSHAVLRRIYAHRGDALDDQLAQRFRDAEQKSPQGKYGRHQYDLADFGIDAAYIDQHTAAYQQYQKKLFSE